MREKTSEKKPTIIAVKKWNKRGGKLYGPYPKDPDEYYLYEETVDSKAGEPKLRYLGQGKKPEGAIVKEVVGVTDLLLTGKGRSAAKH